jgi:hypothetical protein
VERDLGIQHGLCMPNVSLLLYCVHHQYVHIPNLILKSSDGIQCYITDEVSCEL